MSVVALYRRAFRRGATDSITIEPADGTTAATGVLAKVMWHNTGDLVGAVEASRYSIEVLAEGLPFEPRDGDVVRMRGRRYMLEGCDPHRRSQAGVTLAYHFSVKA